MKLCECGNANLFKCCFCGEYDEKHKLYMAKNGGSYHRACHSEYGRKRRIKAKEAKLA